MSLNKEDIEFLRTVAKPASHYDVVRVKQILDKLEKEMLEDIQKKFQNRPQAQG